MSTVVISRDGRHLAYFEDCDDPELVFRPYADGTPKKKCVVVDGTDYGPYDEHIANAASSVGAWSMVVDGKAEGAYDQIEGLTFSPDSKRAAYVAAKGPDSWEVVVDGQAGPEYHGIITGSPVFSRDGKHVAYAARRGTKSFAVVDGRAVAAYDGIVKGSLTFGTDGILRYFALRNIDLYRVEYAPKLDSSRPDLVEKAPSSARDPRLDDPLALLMGINQRTASGTLLKAPR
jgi:roadblock/LC7 domain-containing protein